MAIAFKKTGIEYYDLIGEYVASCFKDANNYDEAQIAFNKLSKLEPEEVSQEAGNKDFNIYIFYREVKYLAYSTLFQFYQKEVGAL